jgi:hypothetical protein
MHWFAILAVFKAAIAALWKPIAGFLLARQLARTGDLKKSNEVRRRAQAAEEKHRENIPRIDDDTLDKRLHELRSRK